MPNGRFGLGKSESWSSGPRGTLSVSNRLSPSEGSVARQTNSIQVSNQLYSCGVCCNLTMYYLPPDGGYVGLGSTYATLQIRNRKGGGESITRALVQALRTHQLSQGKRRLVPKPWANIFFERVQIPTKIAKRDITKTNRSYSYHQDVATTGN